ncbi:glucose inhibited division protein a [Holotrichia oblita]|nr:glucose inhibited division protein a [Holotrichia oblita]
MKKTFTKILAAVFIFAVTLTGFTACAARDKTLRIYNWGDYMDETVISQFKEYYKEQTGEDIKVVYREFASNEDVYNAVAKKGDDWDLVCPSEYMVERLINEKLFEPIDKDVVDISADGFMSEELRDIFSGYDKGLEYSVPYIWGTFGILYDTTAITDAAKVAELDSWKALWSKSFEGQVYMKNQSRDSYTVAMLYHYSDQIKAATDNFTDYSTTEFENIMKEIFSNYTQEKIAIAKNVLIEQKELVARYETDEGKMEMADGTGKGKLGLFWSCDAGFAMNDYESGGMSCASTSIEGNRSLKYIVPKEGSNVWCDAWVIPANAGNKTAANMFLKFLMTDEISKLNASYAGAPSVNQKAMAELREEIEADDEFFAGTADWFKDMYLEMMFPTSEVLERCYLMINKDFIYDSIVVGIGHAGIEAALALARKGHKTLALSISLDNAGYLACNPSIGGTAKGHLVREVDALGGEMGKAADINLTQLRMLNSSKGPAVHSLRAQVDKYRYRDYMKSVLENEPNLHLRQGEVKNLLVENGEVVGVESVLELKYYAKAVVLACGVYLESSIITGGVIENKGPASFARSEYLAKSLIANGITLRRFKTGTPARVKRASINLEQLEVQPGEDTPYSFSSLSKKSDKKHNVCYLGYTNEDTHDIIRQNLRLSPKYGGLIHGAGARYCPSVEDKIVRFADKERHQFFLEPEGERTQEMYVQGLSTGLPAEVQLKLYRSIKGFENIEIMRDAYAIEYECIDPTQLFATLMCKKIKGLFFAGQINGTSGYEEAAAQGIVAGINAALYLEDKPSMILERSNSIIILSQEYCDKILHKGFTMNITEVRIRLVKKEEGKMKAIASITIDDCFVVHDIKIIQGNKNDASHFIAMPSKKTPDGEFKDIVHPLNTETREKLSSLILAEFEKVVAEAKEE